MNAQLCTHDQKQIRDSLSAIDLLSFCFHCYDVSRGPLWLPRELCLVSGCYVFVKVTARLGERMLHSRGVARRTKRTLEEKEREFEVLKKEIDYGWMNTSMGGKEMK